jgi:hypothetical protein
MLVNLLRRGKPMISRRFVSTLLLILSCLLSGHGTVSYAAGSMNQPFDAPFITTLPLLYKDYVGGFGSVTGVVFDATSVDRLPVSGASVCYSDQCSVTGEDGTYLIENLPDGLRHVSASREEYYSLTEDVKIRPNEISRQDFALTPLAEITDVFMRVLLTWSETESWPPDGIRNDLDAHLWLEAPDPPTHIDFTERGDCTTFPDACLEVDYQQGYGPETLAIRQLQNTVYYYGVLNYYAGYPGVPDITESQAKVRVYQEGGVFMEFSVPAVGEGDFWYVFQLISDGGTATLIEKNCITSYDISPPACPGGHVPGNKIAQGW